MVLNNSGDLCSPGVCAEQYTEQNTSCDPASFNMGSFETFATLYNNSHGIISAAICILGVILNIFTTIVLTRPTMRTPTNFLLTTISIADTITMATYAVYTLYLNVLTLPSACGFYRHDQLWIIYILLHTWLMISTHSIATIVMVVLAGMRCISVYYPLSGPKLCTLPTVKFTVLVVCIVSALSASPVLFMYRVCRISTDGSWWFEIRVWATNLETANFIIYGMVVKILASVLISILSAFLILAMRRASQRRSRLRGQKGRRISKGDGKGVEVVDPQTREHNRNTAMLAMVVISFVVTEFPQGVLNMSAALSLCFHFYVYAKIGSMLDALVLLNSSINFILYCAMSQQFRETFCHLFFCRCRHQNRQRNGYRCAASKTTAL